MKSIFLLSIIVCCALPLLAQPGPYEQQMVQFADGENELLWISLDPEADLLSCKKAKRDEPITYPASQIVSFRYGDAHYFSLPLREGYFCFFRILYEGKEFAIMEKTPSFKALSMIADESDGRFILCQKKDGREMDLCEKENYQYGFGGGHGANTNAYSGRGREVYVEKLVYLAIEGNLKLFYMETGVGFFLWDLIAPRPGKRAVDNMLEDFIEDPKKRAAIYQKVKEDKLDIRDPQDLIVAIKAVYR